MSHNDAMISPSELYVRIATAIKQDPSLEPALLENFDGTLLTRFGLTLPKSGKLVSAGEGYRLTYDGRHYDLGTPQKAADGELNDAELELVSGGNNANCPPGYNNWGLA